MTSVDKGAETAPASTLDRFLRSAKASVKKEDWVTARERTEGFLAKYPRCPEALFVQALIAANTDDLAQAAASAREAAELQPHVAEHPDLLAVIHALAGDLNSSVYFAKLATAGCSSERLKACMPPKFPSYARVLQIIAEKPLLRRAATAMTVRAWSKAEFWLRQHLAFHPHSREGYLALGGCLLADHRAEGAIEALRAARHQLPDDTEIASLLARALTAAGLLDQARACHRWAVAHAPEDAAIHAASLLDRLHEAERKWQDHVADFTRWGRAFGVRYQGRPCAVRSERDRPLTIGYLVAGRGDSPIAGALTDILSRRRKQRFGAVGFGYGPLSHPTNLVFQKCVERWQDIAGADPLTLAAMVRAERVDILVDLSGFSAAPLLTAFGDRMARCQVAWLDSPAGTGLACMDFLLTDRYVDPETDRAQPYREALERLDLGCAVVAPPEPVVDLSSTASCSGITFAADAPPVNLQPSTVATWAEIVHGVPGSVLLLRDHRFTDPENLSRLIGLFGDFGVAHRVDVVVEATASRLFAQADIALLPSPCPKPQVAVDALSAGVPVICPAGLGRHARLAASVIHHLGLGDRMLASTAEEYVALALAWARDGERRDALRSTVRDHLTSAPALDPERRMRDLEAAFERMWTAVECRDGDAARTLKAS